MRSTSVSWRAVARPLLLAMTAFTISVAVRAVREPLPGPAPEQVPLVASGVVGAEEPDQGEGELLYLPPGHPPIGDASALPPGHPPIAPPLPRSHPVPTVDGPGRPMAVFPQDGTSSI